MPKSLFQIRKMEPPISIFDLSSTITTPHVVMQRRGILAFKAWGDFHKVNYIRELRMGDMNTYTRGYRLHLQSGKTGRQEPRRRRRRKEEAEHTPRANIFKPGDPSFRWEKQDLLGPCAQGPRPRPRPATWQRQPLSFPPQPYSPSSVAY